MHTLIQWLLALALEFNLMTPILFIYSLSILVQEVVVSHHLPSMLQSFALGCPVCQDLIHVPEVGLTPLGFSFLYLVYSLIYP